MFKPGQKVAHQVVTRPDMLALGVVEPDGLSVRWTAFIDGEGCVTRLRSRMAVPLNGDEQPCPEEFEDLF